jgi:hypothetical protein
MTADEIEQHVTRRLEEDKFAYSYGFGMALSRLREHEAEKATHPQRHLHSPHADRNLRACIDTVMFHYSVDEIGAFWNAILFGTEEQKNDAIESFGEAVQDQLREDKP